jgi:hypothetical protein
MTLDDLDELGEIMSDMLQKQQGVEVPFHTIRCHHFLKLRNRMDAKSSSMDSSNNF